MCVVSTGRKLCADHRKINRQPDWLQSVTGSDGPACADGGLANALCDLEKILLGKLWTVGDDGSTILFINKLFATLRTWVVVVLEGIPDQSVLVMLFAMRCRSAKGQGLRFALS